MGCDIHPIVEVRKNGKWKQVDYDYNMDLDGLGARNYRLFSVLADVRNSYNITPISSPRGLPEDFVHEHRYNHSVGYDTNSLGDHSFSWLTLKEILDYSWDKIVPQKKFVTKEFYKTWDGQTPPHTTFFSHTDGIEVEWNESVRDLVGKYFWDNVIPDLQKLANNPEDIRIVFGFDN
jgi:hypothetical protein